MAALQRILWLGLATLVAVGPAGCKTAKQEAKAFKKCGRDSRCRKPNVCIRTNRAGEGICVYPCQRHQDCPEPFRCTGAYKLRGKPGAYCRRPSVDAGGDCSRVQDGCKAGLRCFKNKCVRVCEKTADCPDPKRRCLKVIDETPRPGMGPKPGTENLYLACLDAPQKHGERCSSSGPFCTRKHVCYERQCYKTCKGDKGCAGGHICDGGFWRAKGGLAPGNPTRPPDIRYCRPAGSKDAFCDLSKGKTCQRGLACLGSRCRKLVRVALQKRCHEVRGIFCVKGAVCFSGRCRKRCKVNQDCPKKRRKHGKCQLRTVHNKKQGLCF